MNALREAGAADEIQDFEEIARAVPLLWEKGNLEVAKQLSAVDRAPIVDVARRAITLQREWAKATLDAFQRAKLEELEEGAGGKADEATLEALRAEIVRGHQQLSVELGALAGGLSGRASTAPLVAAAETDVLTDNATGTLRQVLKRGPAVSRVLSRLGSSSSGAFRWLEASGSLATSPAATGMSSISLASTIDASDSATWLDVFASTPLFQSGIILWLDLGRSQTTLDALAALGSIEPVGFLHLERLTFTPVGYERGELVYSLPLVSGERARFTHREWTRTETEYERIAATSLDTAVEDTLSEKSELTESVSTESQRSSALDASVDAEGGYGPVSISTHVGYSAEESETASREQTAKRSQEITRKASTRSKKEHKITFRVTRETGIEDESYREIHNPTDEPVRWEFYRMMKKWEIDLYRYGVRLTYDVVLPEPGSYVLRRYLKLRAIQQELSAERTLSVGLSGVTRDSWRDLASTYGARLAPPPDEHVHVVSTAQESGKNLVAFRHLEIVLPDGYEFEWWEAFGDTINRGGRRAGFIDPLLGVNGNHLRSGLRHSNRYQWRYLFDASEPGAELGGGDVLTLTVNVRGVLSGRAFAEWQAESYARLIDAFEAQRAGLVARLEEERRAMRAELDDIDALKLRKLEKEEIMKGVLRMMLGADFRFYSERLPALGVEPEDEVALYDPETGALRAGVATELLKHGQVIRFLHHAIEWENVNYVLYPYFWTDVERWDFKQSLDHPDFVHRNFLRSGAARVVLTVRPGFERSFLSFVETADTEGSLPDEHPYMTLADEVRAMAEERYPYTPGGIVLEEDRRVDRWYEYTPTGALDVMRGEPL